MSVQFNNYKYQTATRVSLKKTATILSLHDTISWLQGMCQTCIVHIAKTEP